MLLKLAIGQAVQVAIGHQVTRNTLYKAMTRVAVLKRACVRASVSLFLLLLQRLHRHLCKMSGSVHIRYTYACVNGASVPA